MTERLHKFLGEETSSLLRGPFEATLYPVVYAKDQAASRIKPFLVGDGRILVGIDAASALARLNR